MDAIPATRQNLLFSATYPDKTKELAARVTSEPVEIRIAPEEPTVASIEQRVIEVDATNRGPLLRQLLKDNDWSLVLVFVASKRPVAIWLRSSVDTDLRPAFNGNLEQDLRTETLGLLSIKSFKFLRRISQPVAWM